ncbi:MAG: hypothetical protein U9Q16_01400, partial [Patescibacteria group bacterium]|nr:hypothetical protein [Patescibacteria group bacterium]
MDTIAVGYFTAGSITVENLSNESGVINGLTIPTSDTLTSTISAGLLYVNDTRIDFVDTPKDFTESVDTYVDIEITGVVVYTEVAVGAGAPALSAPNQRIAVVTTDATTVTTVVDLRTVIVKTLNTKSYSFSTHEDVTDYYSYMYSLYTPAVDRSILFDVFQIGTKIRVTLTQELTTGQAKCGFLVGGESVNMGESLYGVNFSFQSYSVKDTDDFGIVDITKRGIQDLVDFETDIPSSILSNTKRKIKTMHDEIVVFIVDDTATDESKYENLLTLGTVENVT